MSMSSSSSAASPVVCPLAKLGRGVSRYPRPASCTSLIFNSSVDSPLRANLFKGSSSVIDDDDDDLRYSRLQRDLDDDEDECQRSLRSSRVRRRVDLDSSLDAADAYEYRYPRSGADSGHFFRSEKLQQDARFFDPSYKCNYSPDRNSPYLDQGTWVQPSLTFRKLKLYKCLKPGSCYRVCGM